VELYCHTRPAGKATAKASDSSDPAAPPQASLSHTRQHLTWREYGLTLILVTHDSTVAGRAQRIGLMRDGRLEIKQDTEHAAS
jgi:hypothetical protein